jgi:hypothetical protein
VDPTVGLKAMEKIKIFPLLSGWGKSQKSFARTTDFVCFSCAE